MEATAVKGRTPGAVAGLTRRSWYDLRPIILVAAYLSLYLGLEWSGTVVGSSSSLCRWHLSAGLSFGLLLSYGLQYAPVVLAAGIACDLWIYPLALPYPQVILNALGMTLLQVVAASAMRHSSSGSGVGLKYGRDVAKFLAAGTLVSGALAAATTAFPVLAGAGEWQNFPPGFKDNFVGFATGIFAVTPFLLIHASPALERWLAGMALERSAQNRYLQTLRMDRPTVLFALSFLSLAGLAFWLIRENLVVEQLQVFLLLSIPLVWVAIRRGLEGLSIAVPAMIALYIMGILHPDGDPAGLIQGILLAASLNAYMIGTGATRVQVTNRQVERRDAILDAVSYAAQQFLGKNGWESGLQEVMRRLGEASAVTRVYISERRVIDSGGPAGDTWVHEWSAPGMNVSENDRKVLNLLRAQLVEEHTATLETGKPGLFHTREIDRKQREMFETLGVRSTVIVPMFVDRQWWGCLGLEQCFIDRHWPASEIDGLKTAGQVLGTLIASVRVEQQFRQLTGNIQAVFWISAPDGLTKQYVSPGYEDIWGRSCASLQRQPGSWLEAVHPEDQERIYESLVKQSWGEYDEEYRLLRPDGSLRWVRDRAFPVRDQAGQVYRIVGLAEDITGQKKTEEQLRAATVLFSHLIDNLQSGVVVEDEERHITHVNQAFSSMFHIPVPPTSLFGVDSRLLFMQTARFSDRIETIIGSGAPVLAEELPWQDRIFLRNYVPLSVGENYRYHLWQYQDVTDSRHAEEQIRSSLKEKEVLLKEIHHRVKNNLQIICSLLSLQSNEIEDPKATQRFKESQDRVKAMALIHERLYQSRDLAKIDFAEYVRNLTGYLVRSYKVRAHAIRLVLEVDSVPMNLDVAIPCGLIINELVSNSLKYAFPNGNGGEIRIRFADQNRQALVLTVGDSGVGFPDTFNPEESQSLGLKLVRSLTEQLGGSVTYHNQEGFLCSISIPRNKNWSGKEPEPMRIS